MNLLCPNCHKMLTVPDQSAGQRMQCPLCAGVFTVPALPQASAPTTTTAASAASAPLSPPVGTSPAPSSGFVAEAPMVPAHEIPANSIQPTLAAPPFTAAPSVPSSGLDKETSPGTGVASAGSSFTLDPRPIHWLPFAFLVLVFIFSFFPWVKYAPGGYTLLSQNGWQAAFNGAWENEDLLRDRLNSLPDNGEPLRDQMNMNGWSTIFLLVTVLALPVALGAALLPYLHVQLPVEWKPYVRLRAGLAAILVLVGLFFLSLQIFVGFSLEHRLQDRFDAEITSQENKISKDKDNTALARDRIELHKAELDDSLRRTAWLSAVYVLDLAAFICALLSFWLELRGERPPLRAVFHA